MNPLKKLYNLATAEKQTIRDHIIASIVFISAIGISALYSTIIDLLIK
jgi:hypothetical protein